MKKFGVDILKFQFPYFVVERSAVIDVGLDLLSLLWDRLGSPIAPIASSFGGFYSLGSFSFSFRASCLECRCFDMRDVLAPGTGH